MEIIDSIVYVFDFIYSVFDTIIQGIFGLISITTNLIGLANSIIRILPNPLYPCMLVFLNLYLVIFIFKVTRKG